MSIKGNRNIFNSIFPGIQEILFELLFKFNHILLGSKEKKCFSILKLRLAEFLLGVERDEI